MREPPEIATIIARRELYLKDGPPVVVEIGAPFKVQDEHEEYWCPYRISGIGSGRVRAAIGIDSVQALWLALQMIGATLYSSEEYGCGRLRSYPDDWSRSLGFPVYDSMRDLLPDDEQDPGPAAKPS